MKNIQGVFLTGYVTISVTGAYPEQFFEQCVSEGIVVWNIKVTADETCEGNIKLRDISLAKQISEKLNYQLELKQEKGLPFFFKLFLRRKEFMVAFGLSILFILFLSNIVWSVEVTGVSKEIEKKINEQLDEYGVHPGSWVFSIDSPSIIQQNLTNDIPELLWVGVERNGTTYQLEGVEKVIVEEEEKSGPANLVAAKSAIIQKIFIKKGVPKVKVNDYVQQADILASGNMTQSDEEDNDNNDDDKKVATYVAADGEVIGRTWYEVNVSIPLKGNFEKLTGKYDKNKFVRLGNLKVPYWGFTKPNYEHVFNEEHETQLYFLKWELPISLGEMIFREQEYEKIERTHEEAIDLGIEQARKELKLQLGPEIEIIAEKVLHETIDNGKVNLNLFITAEEDIAQQESISQGD